MKKVASKRKLQPRQIVMPVQIGKIFDELNLHECQEMNWNNKHYLLIRIK